MVDVALSAVSYPLWHLKTREQVLGSSCAQHARDLLKGGSGAQVNELKAISAQG